MRRSTLLCTLWALSCTGLGVGELSEPPACFSNGSELSLEEGVLSLNLCCEPSARGDLSCQEALRLLSSPLAPLAICSSEGRCEVCELGVSCECLEHLDCGEGERCGVVSEEEGRRAVCF